jgi:hypothetical protein
MLMLTARFMVASSLNMLKPVYTQPFHLEIGLGYTHHSVNCNPLGGKAFRARGSRREEIKTAGKRLPAVDRFLASDQGAGAK